MSTVNTCHKCMGTGRSKRGGPCKRCKATGRVGTAAGGLDAIIGIIGAVIKLGFVLVVVVAVIVAVVSH